MTEADWNTCTDPRPMLDFLQGKGNAATRKVRLFRVACCRRLWPMFTDPVHRVAVEVAERYADGQATATELRETQGFPSPETLASDMALWTIMPDASIWAIQVGYVEVEGYNQGFSDEQPAHASFLRDIFGPLLFRPVSIDPAWNNGTVRHLAQAIYDERAFDRMPILADALEEAGCTNQDVIEHCRGPGPHVRGCWVVDLLLGKE